MGCDMLFGKLFQILQSKELCLFLTYENGVVAKINVGKSIFILRKPEILGINPVLGKQFVVLHNFGGHQSGVVDETVHALHLACKFCQYTVINKV